MQNFYLSDIDSPSFLAFSEMLDSGKGPLQLHISSDGGDSNSMLAFYDKIQCSERKVIGTVWGHCQSAAVLILAGCHERRCSSSTVFMVHEDTYELSGLHSENEKVVLQHELEEKLWAELMAKHSSVSVSTWRSFSAETTHFTAEEAMDYGIVDSILSTARGSVK